MRVKFADALKSMLRTFLHNLGYGTVDIERMMEGDLKEVPLPITGNPTPRHLMQTLGTEWGRACVADNLWVDVTIKKAMRYIGMGHRVVIDDIRFPNELEAVRNVFDSRTIRIIRTNHFVDTSHPSEGLLDNEVFDFEIINDSDLWTLAQKAKQCLIHNGELL